MARSLPHVCLGHMGRIQQLVTVSEMVFLQHRHNSITDRLNTVSTQHDNEFVYMSTCLHVSMSTCHVNTVSRKSKKRNNVNTVSAQRQHNVRKVPGNSNGNTASGQLAAVERNPCRRVAGWKRILISCHQQNLHGDSDAHAYHCQGVHAMLAANCSTCYSLRLRSLHQTAHA